MYVKEPNGKEVGINMKPGDMIIYRGCDIEHWREPLWANNHAQVFLHYNEKGGEYDIPFDGRPLLGMPPNTRSDESLERQQKIDKNDNMAQEEMPTKIKKIIY